ncbi:hypothetical protein ABBQ32_009692 [Trebouxia sp. C0010 RCD-2024]
MGTASWLVWHNGGWQRHSAALTMYAIQLALNLSWPPLFFSGHKLGMALADSTALLLSVAATTQLFWDAEPAAGKLLLPYLAWTAYATMLNGWIWNKNPKADSAASLKTQPKHTKLDEIQEELQMESPDTK